MLKLSNPSSASIAAKLGLTEMVTTPPMPGSIKLTGLPSMTVSDRGWNADRYLTNGTVVCVADLENPLPRDMVHLGVYHATFASRVKFKGHTGYGLCLPALNYELRMNRGRYKTAHDVVNTWKFLGVCVTIRDPSDRFEIPQVTYTVKRLTKIHNYWNTRGTTGALFLQLEKVEIPDDPIACFQQFIATRPDSSKRRLTSHDRFARSEKMRLFHRRIGGDDGDDDDNDDEGKLPNYFYRWTPVVGDRGMAPKGTVDGMKRPVIFISKRVVHSYFLGQIRSPTDPVSRHTWEGLVDHHWVDAPSCYLEVSLGC